LKLYRDWSGRRVSPSVPGKNRINAQAEQENTRSGKDLGTSASARPYRRNEAAK